MASTPTFCDPCRYRKTNSNACKYCNICRESFCKDCAEFHKASKATRKHFLITVSDSFVGSEFNKELDKVQTCPHHDKSFEFYCQDHKAFLCSMCMLFSESHRECGKLVDISKAGQDLRKKRFADEVRKEMQLAITQSDQATENVRNALSKSEKSKENMSEQLRLFVDSLQNLVDVVKVQVSQIEKSTADQFKYHEDKCLDAIKVFERLKDSAESCDKLSKLYTETGSSADLFRSAIVINDQYKQFVDDFDAVKEDLAVIKIVVEKSNVVEKLETCNKPLFRCKTSKVGVHLKSLSVGEDLEQMIEQVVSFGCSMKNLGKNAEECPTSLDNVCSGLTDMAIVQKGNGNSIFTEESKIKGIGDTNALAQANAVNNSVNEKITDTISDSHEQHTAAINISNLSDAYEDEPDSNSTTLLSNTNDLQEVTKQDDVIKSDPTYGLHKRHEERVVCLKYINSFEISLSHKLAPPKFEDIICLFNNRLVVSDSQNARFLVLSTTGEALNECFIPFQPKCLVNVSKTRFAASIFKDRRIAFVKVKSLKNKDIKGLSNKDITYINARYHTKCIKALGKDKLLVSMTDKDGLWYMDILHVNGTLVQTIDVQGFYDGYFVTIQHLSQTDTFRIIYSSDRFRRLKCCDIDGNFVFSYEVTCIANIITDSLGFIYIFRINGEIIVLTPDGKFFKNEKIDYLQKPDRVAFNSVNGMLYVTTYQSTKIHELHIGH